MPLGSLPDQPHGEDGLTDTDKLITKQQDTALGDMKDKTQKPGEDEQPFPFLKYVQQARTSATMLMHQRARTAWMDSYKAFRNEHFSRSKYHHADFANRSKVFRPKTRSAVRRDLAAVADSMFGTTNAISCAPGDESDDKQRAAARLMEEVVNYRTDRTSGKDAMKWFLTCMGARQDAEITGITISKQIWLLETAKRKKQQPVLDPETQQPVTDPETGEPMTEEVEEEVRVTNRPEVLHIAPENVTIDAGADWRDPAQSSSFLIIEYPMSIGAVRLKEKDPRRPWHHVDDGVLKQASGRARIDTGGVRRAREGGQDRLTETKDVGVTDWDTVFVYECFMRCDGVDYTFFSVEDKAYLTDPAPVEEIYPEQQGDRPISFGYGALEAHRIFPVSPVESWQPVQRELNDLANLKLDATKQAVSPIAKVVRGRSIDTEAVKRRAAASIIMVQSADDITWDKPPEVPQGAYTEVERLNTDFDTAAGHFDPGSVQSNNALDKTLGGLKLVSGAANAVQQFDIRLWIETWVEPTLAQVVKLEQYYEDDQIILGLCGQRAQLWDKFGISEINDDLLEQQVKVKVSAGLGAGDPQQKMAKIAGAIQIAGPIIEKDPRFANGMWQVNLEEILDEIFAAAGYKDGGKRFFTQNQNSQNPAQAAQMQHLQGQMAEMAAKVSSLKSTANLNNIKAMALMAGVSLDKAKLLAQLINDQDESHATARDHVLQAAQMGLDHQHKMAKPAAPPPGANGTGSPPMNPNAAQPGSPGMMTPK